ncbi:hypothetical protein GQ607_017463 [Colletotrichum asianum]|uniref:ABC transporter domain-containing protein n=1 Tax=Colletotrichum asianum TaxID=702518 RepID=A0A8H3VUP4_9PEZI|nr:hypothetical protein GQ607_017463 [Colletotrichum asianum]
MAKATLLGAYNGAKDTCVSIVGLGEGQGDGEATEVSPSQVDSEPEKGRDHAGSPLNLDSEVKENGAKISHGQRSLIFIARTLARRSKIVILDEATALIDGRADKGLQAMLAELMIVATILTVTHRLDTIFDSCDRVLVTERGTRIVFLLCIKAG